MSGVYDKLQAALDASLDSFATAQSIDVAWENASYDPTVGTPYLRVTFMPISPMQATTGTDGYNQLGGLYQVSVFYPSARGSKGARQMADALISHFKRGTSLTSGGETLKIKSSGRAKGINEPNWYHVPVTIDWFAIAANT
jgi:hypothetical protein